MGIQHKRTPFKKHLVYCGDCEKKGKGMFCDGMCDEPKIQALKSDRRKAKKAKKAKK